MYSPLKFDEDEDPILGPPVQQLVCDPPLVSRFLPSGDQICVDPAYLGGPASGECGRGERLIVLADGGRVCVPDDTRPFEPVVPIVPPPPGTKVCPDGSVVIASGPCPQTVPVGGGSPTDPLTPGDDDPPGIFATLMGEDGTNIFGFKPIVAIGAAVAALFVFNSGGKK